MRTTEDFDVYLQAFQLQIPPAQCATKQRTLMFIDKMRAEGRAGTKKPILLSQY